MLSAAIDFLRERKDSSSEESETHLYGDLLHRYEHRLSEIESCGPDGSAPKEDETSVNVSQVLLDTIRRQRKELNLLRDSGRIGDNVHRSLQRELDLSESRLT